MLTDSRCGALGATVLLASLAAAQVDWQQVGRLRARYQQSAVFDAARGRLVVFGGRGHGTTVLAATVEWDGARWYAPQTTTAPEKRFGSHMCYDTARANTVLFGGVGTATLGDTWTWNGKAWTETARNAGPGARSFGAFVFDRARGRAILFGGQNTDLTLNGDTWAFDGSRWQKLQPHSSPSARMQAAAAFDRARGRIVLFGGKRGVAHLTDTWEWDGQTWTEIKPASTPASRLLHAMTYDAVRQRVVLSGGIGIDNRIRDDSWEWDGRTWTQVGANREEFRRLGHSLVYDDARQQQLILCGLFTTGVALHDAWSGRGTTWTRLFDPALPARSAPIRIAFDPVNQRPLLLSHPWSPRTVRTWLFDGTRWQVTPAGHPWRPEPALATGARVLRHGGGTTSRAYGDLSAWDGTSWRTVDFFGPQRMRHAISWDADRKRLVLFGGLAWSPIRVFDETWEWDGKSWYLLRPANRPAKRQYHAMCYDASRQKTVLFGGAATSGQGSVLTNDTWEWDGRDWRQANPAVRPPARSTPSLVYDPARQRVVLVSGRGPQGPLADTWEWDGRTWSERRPSLPGPANHVVAAWNPMTRRTVVYDLDAQDTWSYGPTHPAAFTPFGSPCAGASGTPRITASRLPWLGEPFPIELSGVPPRRSAVLGIGFSRTNWQGLKLPLSLATIGMPGCTLYTGFEVTLPFASGRAQIPVPATPTSNATDFFVQAAVLDPGSNTLGATTTNAGAGRTGAK